MAKYDDVLERIAASLERIADALLEDEDEADDSYEIDLDVLNEMSDEEFDELSDEERAEFHDEAIADRTFGRDVKVQSESVFG